MVILQLTLTGSPDFGVVSLLTLPVADKDFLEFFGRMDRTLLFDSRWVMASHWVFLPASPSPWTSSYGDVSCE